MRYASLQGWKQLIVTALVGAVLAVGCRGSSGMAVDGPLDGPLDEEAVEVHIPIAEGVDFETIERVERNTGNQAAERWQSPAPGVAVIGRVEDVDALGDLVSPAAQAQLRALDYGEKFAMVVFLGHQPHIEEIIIERVHNWGNSLTLLGHVPVYEDSLPSESSPYHIISLQRAWLLQEKPLHFDLWIDDTHRVVGEYPPVLSQSTPVPTATSPYTPQPTYTPWPTGTSSPTFTPPPPGTPGLQVTASPAAYPPPGARPLENSTVTPYPPPEPTSGTPERPVD